MQETICGTADRARSCGAFALVFAAVLVAALALVAALPATAHALTSSESSPVALTALDTKYTIDVDDDYCVYTSFTPSASGYYTIETVGDDDTYGYLYDADGELLASNDDGGDGYNAYLSYYFEAGTTYYAHFTFYDLDYGTAKTITVVVSEAASLDGSADVLEQTSSGSATYPFVPSEDGLYEFTLSMTTSGESYAYVVVYSSDGEWMTDTEAYAYQGSSEGSCSAILEAGQIYTLKVEVYGSEDGYDDPSSLTLTAEKATPVELTETLSRTISFTDASSNNYYGSEWLTFTPSSSGVYTFTLKASGTDYYDVYYTLYSATGSEIKYNYAYDYYGDETARILVASLEAGQTYYLNVNSYYDDTVAVKVSVEQGGVLTSWYTARLYGDTRYETMYEIVQEAMDYSTCDTVIVAAGKNAKDTAYADALAASYAAGLLDCPIVTTKPGELSDEATQAIEELEASTVYIVGGTSAVSSSVEKAIKAIDGVEYVERVAGSTRYETATEIYSTFSSFDTSGEADTAILAYGGNYPDALCASAVSYASGYPILLTKTSDLGTVASVLKANFDNVIIVGGTGVVSQSIENEIEAMGIDVTRIAGSNRYETAVAIAEYAIDNDILSGSTISVATGTNYPDALVGGVLAGRTDGVLLLANGNYDLYSANSKGSVPNAALYGYLTSEYASAASRVYLLGGYDALCWDLEDNIYYLG